MSVGDGPDRDDHRPVAMARGDAGRRVDMYWADFLGIEPADWAAPGISFRTHEGLRGYRGLWCFRHHERIVVSAPEAWVARLEDLWSGWDRHRLLDAGAVAASLGEDCERCIGPAFQGFVGQVSFRDRPSSHVRPVRASDITEIERFRERCGEDAWSVSGLADVGPSACVYADEVEITAMAGARRKADGVGDLCVLADPRFRGCGRGAAVASAVTRDALTSGDLLLYQTLEANRAAVRLAMSLGFERYANHLAVRLKRDAPSSLSSRTRGRPS